MKYIKAPYNFVPLNKKVVIPYWGNHISHDIPFEDCESGDITIKITAHSPIFVRNGVKKADENNAKEFSNFNDEYFIPGSSIKGMVRNVLEIMTFSKIGNKVNDHRYAVRDLSNETLYRDFFKTDSIFCGWLKKNDNETYSIEDCGIPGRILHNHLDGEFHTDFSKFFLKGGGFDQGNNKQKSSNFKYEKFLGHKISQNFTSIPFDSSGRKVYKVDDSGKDKGTIIFTGQSGPRFKKDNGEWTGHHLEFIFFEKKEDVPVSPEVIKDFFFAYYEHDKNRWSYDWEIWRKKLKKGEKIPVFFRKNGKEVSDLGLSYLYKLPYKYSVKESIDLYQKDNGIDMSEAIFGFINESDHETLKGRVHIGHAFATNNPKPMILKKETLSSPKASYYPNYIKQTIKNGKVNRYSTFMDNSPEIAGWKRYPANKKGTWSNTGTDKVSTEFIPLGKGAEFSFKIRYHNLKKIELGALLSALTFHNTDDTFHSLGMAKPLGYGKISLSISDIDSTDDYLKEFEAFMNVSLNNKWHDSEQIKELITMVTHQDNNGNSELKYMKMEVGNGKNQFVIAKNKTIREGRHKIDKGKEALDRYSNLNNILEKKIESLITPSYEDIMRETWQQDEEIFKRKRSLKEILEGTKLIAENEAKKLFNLKKNELLEKLKIAKVEKEAEEIDERKRNKQIKVTKRGLNLDNFDIQNRRAFNNLNKEVQRYVEVRFKKKYKNLIKNKSNGLLPESDCNTLMQTIKSIFLDINSIKEIKKWQKKPVENNHYYKKTLEWIGYEATHSLFKDNIFD